MSDENPEGPSAVEGDRRDFLKRMAIAAGALGAATVGGFTVDGGDTADASPAQWIYRTPPTIPTTEPEVQPTAEPTPTETPAVAPTSAAKKTSGTPKFTG